MKVTKVTYEQLVNTGNYENRRYGIEVTPEAGEDLRNVFLDAKEQVEEWIDTDAEIEAGRRK